MLCENNYIKGRDGENTACEYILKRNFEIVENNYRSPFGEIDIIAKDGEYIVFIEVKFRNDLSHGYPREAVGKGKQKNIIKTAEYYISENNIQNTDFRFDVIEILGHNIEYIENAFWKR